MLEQCNKCGSKDLIYVEYAYGTVPNEYLYDGISEVRCLDCETRFGRWSYRLLKEDELEPRFGGKYDKELS